MLEFLSGLLIGALLMSFYNRIFFVQEVNKVKEEFARIHTRLISVIAEWQKKMLW